jgi:hypothetical protein
LPRSSDIDEALRLVLASDAALMILMPDGAWLNAPPPALKSFVLVTLVSEEDVATFGRREYEDALYRIAAVTRDLGGVTAAAAADRIDALLENVALTVADYTWMTTHREGRLPPGSVVDPVDPSVHWQVSGGNYRVQMAPVWAVAETKE